MNDVLTRARALHHLIAQPSLGAQAQAVAEAVISCSRELIDAGEARLALALLESSSHLADAAGPDWLVRFQIARTRGLQVVGRHEDALRLARELLNSHEHSPDTYCAECSELRIWEASCLWGLNRVDEAVERLLTLRADLLRRPDSVLLAWCALQLSAAEIVRGELQTARHFALEALVSARRAGSGHVEAMALNNHGRIERALCRWAEAQDAARRASEIFERQGNRIQANSARRSLAIALWKCGSLEEASRIATTCCAEGAALANGGLEWLASLLKGMILLHAGDHETARRLFTSGQGWESPRSDSRPSLLTTEFLGDVHLEQGEGAAALEFYDRVWPEALALVPKGDIVAELRRRRAECHYLLGRYQDAYEEARVGLDHCRQLGDRYEEAATYRVLALATAAVGKLAEAKRWFDQGFAYYDDIETPYEWGKLWMAYGDWLRGPHAGEYADLRGALEAYHAARDQFERMGAEAKLAEANARIASMAAESERTSGQSLSGSPGSADAGLTRLRRRPRGSAEVDRRSAWAMETFGFITRNRFVLDLLSDVSKLAAADAPMLILGESGTGKELIANGIHRLSGRKGQFVPINCANLPRDVIESELFGHVAGSFTGATRDKPGLFEVCDGGTAFLDEIAEMPVELQARLLRFLETGEIRRVGANRNLEVDSLVVAATNRDRASLEKGEGFRTDLYYRLAQAVVVIPPLRKRGEDVELLIGHFFDDACRDQGKRVRLSAGARARLVSYAWPGNVRQMLGVLRRLVILGTPDQEIPAEAVQLDQPEVASTLEEELLQAERRRMVEALAQARGSRSDAARALGMARTTLITKMKRYGIH